MKASEIQIRYKSKVKAKQCPVVKKSEDAYSVFKCHWDMDRIEVQFLNRACQVLGIFDVAQGGTSFVVVDVRLIFAAALKANASSLILAHNHPSGVLKPSSLDLLLTKKMREAGRLLGIPVEDHLIMSRWGYLSMSDDGFIAKLD